VAALRSSVLAIVRDLRRRISATVQSAACSAVAAVAALVMAAFLCAALFVWVESLLGRLIACLVLAGLFLLLAIIVALVGAGIRRAEARRAQLRAESLVWMWRDPAVISAGLRLGRTLGLRRAAPLAIIAAFVIGVLLSRSARRQENANRGAAE
jgi:hypothetical protein